jgi:hypothetical protein
LARRGTSGGGSSGKFFGCGRVVTGIGIILNRLEEISSAAMKSLRGARQWNFSVITKRCQYIGCSDCNRLCRANGSFTTECLDGVIGGTSGNERGRGDQLSQGGSVGRVGIVDILSVGGDNLMQRPWFPLWGCFSVLMFVPLGRNNVTATLL